MESKLESQDAGAKKRSSLMSKSKTNGDLKQAESTASVEPAKPVEHKVVKNRFDLSALSRYYSVGRGRNILNKKYRLSDSEPSPEASPPPPAPLVRSPTVVGAESPATKQPTLTLAQIISRKNETKTATAIEESKVATRVRPERDLSWERDSTHKSKAREEEPKTPESQSLDKRFSSLKVTPSPSTPATRRAKDESPCEHEWGRWDTPERRKSPERPDEKLLEFMQEKAKEWKKYPMNLIDTHCHFDMLFNRMNYGGDLINYFDEYNDFYLKNVESFINIACNPVKFSTQGKLNAYRRRMAHSKVYHAFGCHPHFCANWSDEIGILIFNNLNRDDIIAIGECGLDISHKNSVDLELQKQVFKSQLKIAKKTAMPVVIHARGAEDQVLEILKENLPDTHRIHLHCFCAGWKLAQQFLDAFPNLCIGVTPLLTYSKLAAGTVAEMVENIPIERLLLETDAPYFVPRSSDFPYSAIELSHPAFIYATAESVAAVKKLTVGQVLNATRENVRKVYKI